MTDDTQDTANTPVAEKPPENAAVTGSSELPADELNKLTDDIVAALKTVYDPEIPADIYELGLIYKIDIGDDRARQGRHVADLAQLPGGAGLADPGGERGRQRGGREGRQGGGGVGSAVGSEPHVGRGAPRAQYVVIFK